MFTLNNSKCDCIRKENGKWGFYRDLPQNLFSSWEETWKVIKEIKAQGLFVDDIEIVEE